MSYQVLARKYRPASFKQLEGQEHVLGALINALDHDRLHHAYLFTGTRGVGKTTIARILAKCLNCDRGVSSTPCGECPSCTEIAQGRSVDLIEVDAASRTGVDDMRDLLDNVQYMPSASRFKIYLIDEVHMLSKSSFNAMLKTLEEPPEHVKFLFATTDPKKLPITVLSRCLQFNLKNLSPEQIVRYLGEVLDAEQIQYEAAALWQLGRAADGSMRDALSLTDQAISYGDNAVEDDSVRSMLGSIDQQDVYGLLDALLSGDAERMLARVAELAMFAPDYAGLLDDFLGVLHRVTIAQLAPDAIDNSQGDQELVLAVAGMVSSEDVQLLYQIGINGQKDLPYAPDARRGFEMTLLRMLAFTPLEVAAGSGEDGGGGTNDKLASRENNPLQAILTSLRDEQPQENMHKSVQQTNTQNSHSNTLPPSPVEGQKFEGRKSAPKVNTGDTTALPSNSLPDSVRAAVSPVETVSSAPPVSTSPLDDTPATVITESNSSQDSAEASGAGGDSVPLPATQTIEDNPDPAEQSPVLATVDITSTPWSRLLDLMELAGVTGTLAANCAVGERSEAAVKLKLNEAHASLWNETHENRIAQGLSSLAGREIRVSIEIGEVEDETPAQQRRREKAELQARAVSVIENDTVIQTLIRSFNGKLDESSIKPIATGDQR